MRCFIAVNIDDQVRNEIASATGDLVAGKWDVKWVRTENLHITLKFLGDISDDLAENLKERLTEMSARTRPFQVRLRGAGVFPPGGVPRVAWIDIEESGALTTLQEQLEQLVVSLGVTREDRHYSPHLTIGRIRSLKNGGAFMKAIEPLKNKDFGNIGVKKISLMKSDLKPGGAQYTIVAEFLLKKEAQ